MKSKELSDGGEHWLLSKHEAALVYDALGCVPSQRASDHSWFATDLSDAWKERLALRELLYVEREKLIVEIYISKTLARFVLRALLTEMLPRMRLPGISDEERAALEQLLTFAVWRMG